MFKMKSILGIMVLGLVFSVGFSLIMIRDARAQGPQGCGWIEYYVGENGKGTCTVGSVASGDFLDGTGKANCAFARNGNINCTCHGDTEFPLDMPLFFNETDNCCIYVNGDEPIISDVSTTDITFGLGTPGGRVAGFCKIRDRD